ncbi:uncharacterized protein BCR38DRAFT_428113 [Pseudomassariella vexata]|uniref:Uncharacterized protein n=1 Tax=Pseudomassariella vexata TaxID=1141098 RepID=A0A1Y2E8Y2_9PEZI|nr:uncharacterized protein BCR38DRAFT_428113 [Pseudomassariella vexata]ORY67774.1 hypothetical protein BCR38DRAFT_428113 [Pseudomassariella vexata]
MGRKLWVAGLLAAAVPHSLAANEFGPSEQSAHRRGPEIFNAVHNSMRQWGSSLHHNGMSFFVATVPEGVLFHHGNQRPESPTDPDWLAYEIEHAEHFAHGRRRRGPPGRGPPGRGPPGPDGPSGFYDGEMPDDGQHVIAEHDKQDEEETHGYLHVYKTTRPLKFLYVDGMGGGKTNMGTLDSQDYLLRGLDSTAIQKQTEEHEKGKGHHAKRAPGGPMDEQQRAIDLCKLCKEWDLQGVVRMEAGFEIIKCDFSDGLEQIQALQRPDDEGDRGGGGMLGDMFDGIEYVRGLSERYDGIGSTRTIIDYSSMVSAFFFPVNLTNPDPTRPDLPRLSSTTDAELLAMKEYLANVIAQRRGEEGRTIDWQDVSDLVVSRYADRLKYMVESAESIEQLAHEISFLLNVFIDYSADDTNSASAIGRCTDFYLGSVVPVTEADHMILTGFKAVSREICTSLFRVRNLLILDPAPDVKSLTASKSALRALMDTLNWTRFKRCSRCAIDEVCLIPMWPMGFVEDYDSPRCTNGSDTRKRESYWRRDRPGGGKGRGPPPRG